MRMQCVVVLACSKNAERFVSYEYVVAARVVSLASVAIFLYVLFVLLKVSKVVDWSWGVVHVPMWIQAYSGYF